MESIEPIRDGKILHFLKELPAWVILVLMIGIFLVYYQVAREDFVPRIIDGLVGALLTAIVGQAGRKGSATNISADTLQTSDLKTDSMDNASITTGTITAKVSDPNGRTADDITLGPNNIGDENDTSTDDK